MYINKQTKQELSERQIRELFPNVAFPKPFVPPEEYAVVFSGPVPTHDELTETVVKVESVEVNGKFEQRFEVVALPEEVIAEKAAAKEEATKKQTLAEVREAAIERLLMTDPEYAAAVATK